jgi:hypothetical protein
MNIANLLNCKKYRLTKEKEDSFKRPKERIKAEPPEVREQPSNENNMNAENVGKKEESSAKSSNHKHEAAAELPRSPEMRHRPDISFKKINDNCIVSGGKSFECSSISKQEKDIEKGVFEDTSTKKEQLNNKVNRAFLELEESPILSKNGKDFEKSKYYVMPIPQKGLLDEKSISLRSSSKIIDIDAVPFDL